MPRFVHLSLCLLILCLPANAARAADPMAGIWDSGFGDRFELKDGKIKTRGAFGRYSGKTGKVVAPTSHKVEKPMECTLELVDSATMNGVCTGGNFIHPYEFTARRVKP